MNGWSKYCTAQQQFNGTEKGKVFWDQNGSGGGLRIKLFILGKGLEIDG